MEALGTRERFRSLLSERIYWLARASLVPRISSLDAVVGSRLPPAYSLPRSVFIGVHLRLRFRDPCPVARDPLGPPSGLQPIPSSLLQFAHRPGVRSVQGTSAEGKKREKGGRGDSNPRPSEPQSDALTKLSYFHHDSAAWAG